jgi:SAM-dependent methyltransferase
MERSAPSSAALDAYKRSQRELWSAGDYAVTARRLEDVAAELVGACAVAPGQRVLDIAAGNGNGALAATAAGASAAACDLTPALVEAGRRRTSAAGVDVDWSVADAEALPFDDGSFDAAISIFGLFLAPRPAVAIAEAFRVTGPGGAVGLASWTPGSAAASFAAIGRRHLPAPPAADAQALAVPSPYEWGDEAIVRERLAPHCRDVRFELAAVRWSWPSAAAAREELEESNNLVAAARRVLAPERLIALVDELDDFMRSVNTARDGGLTYEAEYARVVGRKPA